MAKREAEKTSTAGSNTWSKENIIAFSPDEASIPAAVKVLKKGGFGTVEATADGKGWWVVCRGLTDVYQVSVRIDEGALSCECTCPSPKYPCKHALALLLYLSEHPEERTEPEAPKYAPTDFEALVRSVFQNPDDDTPRLIFADFLEENDQPDRAALIRLQCEMARHRANSSRYRELEKEERELLARLRKVIHPLPEDVFVQFHRGFLTLNTYLLTFRDVGALPERFINLFRDGWVETVHVIGQFFETLGEGHAGLFALAGELDLTANPMNDEGLLSLVAQVGPWRASGRLCRVNVAKRNQDEFDRLLALQQGQEVTDGISGESRQVYNALSPQILDLLIRSGRFRAARSLYLHGFIGDPGAEQFAATDLGNLEELYLVNSGIGEAGMKALANAPDLGGLTGLGITQSPLPPEAITALVAGTSLARLERLDLTDAEVGDSRLVELAGTTRFHNIQTLDLQVNRLTALGIASLLRSPNFPALQEIILDPHDLDDRELLPLLLNARERPELRINLFQVRTLTRRCGVDGMRLDLAALATIPETILSGLTGCAVAKRLVGLAARGPILTPQGLQSLATALSMDALLDLEIRDARLGNAGAEELASAFQDYRLRSLSLPFCRIQASGIAALAGSQLLGPVKRLDLTGNTIGKGGAVALANSPHLGNLDRLELTGQKLGTTERKLLGDRFGTKLNL